MLVGACLHLGRGRAGGEHALGRARDLGRASATTCWASRRSRAGGARRHGGAM